MNKYSTLTCPYCGALKKEKMPTNACQYSYECSSCGKVMQTQKGDCCVYCSYGDVRCPSKQ